MVDQLIAVRVRPDEAVAVMLERGASSIAAMLGVLKSGAAYLPVDRTHPQAHLDQVLADARVRVIIGDASDQGRFHGRTVVVPPDPASRAMKPRPAVRCFRDALAYVIYTSGSTGYPKGVAMPHRALDRLIAWQIAQGSPGARATLNFAPVGFDVSLQEILSTLCSGGVLQLITEETRRDPARLLELRQYVMPFSAAWVLIAPKTWASKESALPGLAVSAAT
jgi:non-ribosomal peptide synthetase component F